MFLPKNIDLIALFKESSLYDYLILNSISFNCVLHKDKIVVYELDKENKISHTYFVKFEYSNLIKYNTIIIKDNISTKKEEHYFNIYEKELVKKKIRTK